ncbi:MAG: thermonuclease family protein [Candidatus Peribacteraceae bacterium]|nr:thermonuclease family protein [Candidatus Peribacteraceae bacterium]
MKHIILTALLFLSACSPAGAVQVSSVTDGDTIIVRLTSGKEERVRFIGIDTPETVHPSKPVQCFGEEASDHMKEMLAGKTVTIVRKPDEDRDYYDRLLRYVELDGQDIGARMIAEGYAFSYKSFPHPRLEKYNALEKAAREAGRGLWGEECEYSKRKK